MPRNQKLLPDPFQALWNQKYFHTDPTLCSTYKNLYNFRADLDYVDYICVFLKEMDGIVSRSKKRLKEDPSTLVSIHPSAISKRRKQWVRQAIPHDELTESKISDFKAQEETMRVAEQRKAAHVQLIFTDHMYRKDPLEGLKTEYTVSPWLYSTGARRDDHGTFFLLAITEHLRERTGKPHSQLAGELLRKLRGDETASSYQDRVKAKARVHQLKKLKSDDWQAHLEILITAYNSPQK